MKNCVVFILTIFAVSMFLISCGDDNSTSENGEDENGDSNNSCSVEITPDSCIEQACGYEWDACKNNCECVELHECDLDCYECGEAGTCDESDCLDGCMSAHRTGTTNMVDIGRCLQENQVCLDSKL